MESHAHVEKKKMVITIFYGCLDTTHAMYMKLVIPLELHFSCIKLNLLLSLLQAHVVDVNLDSALMQHIQRRQH